MLALAVLFTPISANAQSANFQGDWSGTTAQGHPISFTVGPDGITEIALAIEHETAPGAPCTVVGPATRTKTYATPNPITAGQATDDVAPSPPVTYVITFGSSSQATGTLAQPAYNVAAPGDPPCNVLALATTFSVTNGSPTSSTTSTSTTVASTSSTTGGSTSTTPTSSVTSSIPTPNFTRSVKVDPDVVPPGSKIKISGTGCPSSGSGTTRDPLIDITPALKITNPTVREYQVLVGDFSLELNVAPDATLGDYTVQVRCRSNLAAVGDFDYEPLTFRVGTAATGTTAVSTPVRAQTLSRTGSNPFPIVGLGLLAIVLGLFVTGSSWRPALAGMRRPTRSRPAEFRPTTKLGSHTDESPLDPAALDAYRDADDD